MWGMLSTNEPIQNIITLIRIIYLIITLQLFLEFSLKYKNIL